MATSDLRRAAMRHMRALDLPAGAQVSIVQPGWDVDSVQVHVKLPAPPEKVYVETVDNLELTRDGIAPVIERIAARIREEGARPKGGAET